MTLLPTPHIFLTILLPLLLAGSFFFSGTETAFFSLTRHERHRLRRSNSLLAAAIKPLLEEARALLITLLLGNMIVNVLYFVITTILLLGLRERGKAGAIGISALSVGFLLALIVVGEVMPKLVAAKIALAWVHFTALPLLVIHRAIGPVRVVLSALVVTPLARLIAPRERPAEFSPDELGTLLEMSQRHGLIDPGEEQLLQGVLALSTLKVRDLMTPRVDIQAFDLVSPPAELVELIHRSGRTRIPVYRRDLDHIVGVVNAREMLLHQPRNTGELRPLIRQVNFVPELQRADDLLRHFRKTGTTLAIVVDEYGGTSGLVTLVDVVRPMVGQIAAPVEHAEAPQATLIGLGVWRVSGELPVHEWVEAFGQAAVAPGITTLGGLVMARLGRLPRIGDRIALGNLTLEVEKMKGRRIESVILSLTSPTQPPQATEAHQTG